MNFARPNSTPSQFNGFLFCILSWINWNSWVIVISHLFLSTLNAPNQGFVYLFYICKFSIETMNQIVNGCITLKKNTTLWTFQLKKISHFYNIQVDEQNIGLFEQIRRRLFLFGSSYFNVYKLKIKNSHFSVYELDHITTNTVCSAKQPQCKYTWDEWRKETAMHSVLQRHFVIMCVKVFWFSSMLAILNRILMDNTVHNGYQRYASSNFIQVHQWRHLLHFFGNFRDIATEICIWYFADQRNISESDAANCVPGEL